MDLTVVLLFFFSFLSPLQDNTRSDDALDTHQISFQLITRLDGLANETIFDINQDLQGYVWFATEGGLSRYDGRGIESIYYSNSDPNSISTNWINTIQFDNEGNGWIGSAYGLNFFHSRTGTFSQILHHESITHTDGIAVLLTLPNSNIVLFQNGIAILFNTKDLTTKEIKLQGSFISTPLHELAAGKRVDGWTWIRSRDEIVFIDDSWETTELIQLNALDSKSAPAISGLNDNYFKPENHGWFSVENHFFSFDSISSNIFSIPNQVFALSNDQPLIVNKLYRDQRKNLWVASSQGLFFQRKNSGSFLKIVHDQLNVPDNAFTRITSLFVDRSDNLWISIRGLGLMKANLSRFLKRDIDIELLGSPDVRAIWETQQGQLWIGHHSGITVLSPTFSGWELNPLYSEISETFSGDAVYSILEDRESNFWIGAVSGLYFLDATTDDLSKLSEEEFPCLGQGYDKVRSLHQDQFGFIWAGTEGSGLCRLSPNTGQWDRLVHDPSDSFSLSNNNVNAFFEEAQYLWIATSRGLNRWSFQDRTLVRWDANTGHPEPLPFDFTVTIHSSIADEMWIGCYGGGLHHLASNGDIQSFWEENGLPSNSIHNIAEDGIGFLWITTDVGLVRFHPQSQQFQSIDVGGNTSSKVFNVGASYKNQHGIMYFGSNQGIDRFDPEFLSTRISPLQVFIQDVRRLDIESFETTSDRPKNPQLSGLMVPKEIQFTAEKLSIQFLYAAHYVQDPQQVRFWYKLDGFDESWNEAPVSTRSASYSHLPPGKYQFKVKATMEPARRSEAQTSLTVHIVSPKRTMRTLIQGLLVGILFISLLLGIYFGKKKFSLGKGTKEIPPINRKLQSQSKSIRTAVKVPPEITMPSSVPFIESESRISLPPVTNSPEKTSNILQKPSETEVESGKSVPKNDCSPESIGSYILLISNHSNFLETFTETISPLFEVEICHDGIGGLEIGMEQAPSLIISDTSSTMIDGLELADFFKNNKTTRFVPILLVANQVLETSRPISDVKVDGFLRTTIDSKQLLLMVSVFLKRKYGSDIFPPVWLSRRAIGDLNSQVDTIFDNLLGIAEANYQNPEFGVFEMAEIAGLSRRQLHRKVTKMLGITPTNFLKTYRLQQAAKMLCVNSGNIAEVCYAIGFSTPGYFSNQFKQQFGRSPSEFVVEAPKCLKRNKRKSN